MLIKKLLQITLAYQMRLKRKQQEKQRLKNENNRLAKLLNIKRDIK